jgi:adenosylcobinamide kinase/adenosylcobinamide-phosphate guanylyltransferase
MILIIGGVKSGKSIFALDLAMKHPPPRAFLATAEPFNEEMKAKIRAHKEKRGDAFEIFEEPVQIYRILPKLHHNIIVIDCITTWLGNIFHRDLDPDREFERLLHSLSNKEIIVSNEVGCGVIPSSKLARRYAEKLGIFNKKLAERAQMVFLMTAGIERRIK